MSTKPICRACLRSFTLPTSRNVATSLRPAIVRASTSTAHPNHRPIRLSPSNSVSKSYSTQVAPPPAPAQSRHDLSKESKELQPQEDEKEVPSDHQVVYAITEALFKECASQADYTVPQAFQAGADVPKNVYGEEVGTGSGWWYEGLSIDPTFRSWSQITMLHMWLLIVRIRCFEAEPAQVWMQNLTDHFFYEAEHRMALFHKINSRAYRQRYLKDLHTQWRGVMGAYDEGLVKGDAVLGAAVWRNLFQASENADWRQVATVVAFMRRVLATLDRSPNEPIVNAMIKFGNPLSGMPLVLEPSEMMEQPFNEEDEETLKLLWEDKIRKKED